MAPVIAEAQNKTDPIYVSLAEASKTKTFLRNFKQVFYNARCSKDVVVTDKVLIPDNTVC